MAAPSERSSLSRARRWVSKHTQSSVRELYKPYQDKVSHALPERMSTILSAMPTEVNSVLDVGSNLGDLTSALAEEGYWCVGIEASSLIVKQARQKHAEQAKLAFIHQHIQPHEIKQLPTFDCTLVLSVHHHWLVEHGPVVASEMLQQIVKNTRHVVFFEGASRKERYEPYPPDFTDNDPITVANYHEDFLRVALNGLDVEIRALGRLPCVGDREPYRWNFAIYRSST